MDEVATGVYLARGFPARWVVIPGTGAGHYVLQHGMEATGKVQFLRTLRRAARKSHAKVDRVEFLKPRALAPVVTITALRPVMLEREGLPIGALLDGSHLRLEGIFLDRPRPGRACDDARRDCVSRGSWSGRRPPEPLCARWFETVIDWGPNHDTVTPIGSTRSPGPARTFLCRAAVGVPQ
jgi:hypothetical protein